jgi:hypothetical protein
MKLGHWAYSTSDKSKACLLELFHLFKNKYSAVITYGFDPTSPKGDVRELRRRVDDIKHHTEISDKSEDDAREVAENWIRCNLFDGWEPPLPICPHCGHAFTVGIVDICPKCGARFRESA